MAEPAHQPVMVRQVVDWLAPRPGGLVVDATVGLGGHAAALLGACPGLRLLGLDVDPEALAVARERLASFGERLELVRRSYWELAAVLEARGIEHVDGVLFDLGVSSLQLDSPQRGFSFRFEAPLDMRFSGGGVTAAELLADADEEELVRWLVEYGEEPRARRVARAIAQARRRATIATTTELRRIVTAALGGRHGKIDPATRTFQALRIATNRELEGIPQSVEAAARALAPGGRVAVISFHSLEDRLVKHALRRLSGRCVCPPGSFACQCRPESLVEVLTPHPARPDRDEERTNPRARSAKLRVAVRRAA